MHAHNATHAQVRELSDKYVPMLKVSGAMDQLLKIPNVQESLRKTTAGVSLCVGNVTHHRHRNCAVTHWYAAQIDITSREHTQPPVTYKHIKTRMHSPTHSATLTGLLLAGRIGGTYAGEVCHRTQTHNTRAYTTEHSTHPTTMHKQVATMQAGNQNRLLKTLGVSPLMWSLAPTIGV